MLLDNYRGSGAALLAALALFPLLGISIVFAQTATEPSEPPTPDEFVVVQGDTLWLVEVTEVVGTRVTAALPGVVRTVGVIDSDDIARLPGRSAAEMLQIVPGVVVGQRQQYGVQSDLSIRGSSFEQVQVLLNGFDLGDPQTGHHLMDLPVGRQDIQRLEVLPGHGSVLYGSGAFGGTVNVVSKNPALPDTAGHPFLTSAEVATYGGSGAGGTGTWGGWGQADVALGRNTGVRVSGEGMRTDGHYVEQDNGQLEWGRNDADTYSGTAMLSHRFDGGEADLLAGYSDRQFGAQDFYAPYDSYEKTKAVFVAGRYKRSVSDRLTLEPRLFYRRHRDEFILFRDNPDAYTNDHISRKAGGELRALVQLGANYTMSISAEGAYEDIDSRGLRGGTWGEALGQHLRRRASLAAEVDGKQNILRWQLGTRVDNRTGYDAQLSGSGAVSAELTEGFQVRASAGSVYRVPTFTELYYRDPSNSGDVDLDPEKGWTWDAGAEYYLGTLGMRFTFFRRFEEDLIEWVRPNVVDGNPAEPWQATNIGEGDVAGVEFQTTWRAGGGHLLSASYVGLDKSTSLPEGLEGKYALLVPRHQIVLQGSVVMQPGLNFTMTGRFLEHSAGPEDFQSHFVLDSRLDWRHASGWFASVAGTNLLGRRYEEVPGVQMPGTLFISTLGHGF